MTERWVSMVRRSRAWAVTAAAAIVLSACGGGGGGGLGKSSAEQYVKTVCTSIGGWVKDIQTRVGKVQKENPSSPQEGKKTITEFFDGVIGSTGKLVGEIKAAGTPDVDNGAQISSSVVTALQKAQSLLQQARARVQALPTDNPHAFVTAVQQISTAVQGAFEKAGKQFSNLKSSQLETAASKEPACKALGG